MLHCADETNYFTSKCQPRQPHLKVNSISGDDEGKLPTGNNSDLQEESKGGL